MKNLFLLGLGICLFLFSCQDDDNSQGGIIVPVSDPMENDITFFPLSEGNYWIYENIRIDTNGVETKLEQLDSIYVAGDTIINNITYAVLRGKKFLFDTKDGFTNIIRESSGDIIDVEDNTIFSNTNFTDIINVETFSFDSNEFAKIEYSMEEIAEDITVPAGTFDEVLNYRGKLIALSETKADSIRYIDNYYSKGIGKIFETNYFFSSNNIFEKRLIRFALQ